MSSNLSRPSSTLAIPIDNWDSRRPPPALGRAPGVEDLKAVLGLLMQRQVRVAEDHRVGLGEAPAHPAEPPLGRAGVVQDRDRGAAGLERGDRRQRFAHLGVVDVAVHGDHGGVGLELPQHR